MWFDVRAALAEIEAETYPQGAGSATRGAEVRSRVADVADVASPPHLKSRNAGRRDPHPPRALDDLTPEERDHYEERAAIMEHDGHLPRVHAESRALAEVLHLHQHRGRRGTSE